MRSRSISLLILVFALVAGYHSAGDAYAKPKKKPKYINVAVYPLKPAGADEATAQALTTVVAYELARSKVVRIIEESALNAVMDKQGLSMSGACDDSECQIEIGKLLNAQKIILGDVGKLGKKYIITMKIIDVQTGATERVDRQDCRCPADELDVAISILAARIRATLEGKTVEDIPDPKRYPALISSNGGDINVMTTPDGADVYLDAELKGKTPMLIQGIKPGIHQITITKNGYSVLNKGIQVTEGRMTEVNEILLARSGEADIKSNPPGAKVFIDEIFKGNTPITVTGLIVGSHNVKLVHDDYQENEGEINIEYQQTAFFNPTLISRPGRILITSTPEGATVYIDGVEMGKTLYAGEVGPGQHNVRISLDGYNDENKQINVQANRSVTLDVVLKKGGKWVPPIGPGHEIREELSFVDDFSSNTNDWCLGNDDYGTWKIEHGEYRRIQTKGSSWCSQGPEFSDFTYQVRIRRVSGKDSNPYGIIFRKQDRDFYAFYIDSTGYYKFEKYENEDWIVIIDWKETKLLYPDVNVIKVKATGSKFEFYSNGKFLDSATDTSFDKGKFGLVVGNWPLVVAFDDLSIKSESVGGFKPRTSAGDFFDNFSSNANDWCVEGDDYGRWYLKNGEYYREQTKGSSWCSQDKVFKNFVYEVRMRRVSGKDSNPYGIIFRKQDRNFYAFFIDGSGYYKLEKYQNDDWISIIDWKESSYLTADINVIKVKADGPNLQLYANGHFIDSAKDYAFTKGKFGVVVGNSPLVIAFDNLSVKEIK